MTSYGPEDRVLFENDAVPLYQQICEENGVSAEDPRVATGGELRGGLDLLIDMGLISLDDENRCWVAEDPTSVQARVVSPLSQQAAKLMADSSSWSSAFSSLAQTWRRTPQSSARGPFTYLREDAINPYLDQLVSECEQEMLTAQPQAGHSPRFLARATLRDVVLLERGASMRTLYQHSARRNSATHRYVAAVTARGAEVRTLDEFFNRMIIVDRLVAVIPNQEDLRVAVAIREPAVVAYLIDVFERSWERARTFTNRETSMLKDIAVEQRAMSMRMLIEGHADQVSAKRLGVSPRTYAGYVADLKSEYETTTRFQLGYTLGRMGLSGREPTPEDDEVPDGLGQTDPADDTPASGEDDRT